VIKYPVPQTLAAWTLLQSYGPSSVFGLDAFLWVEPEKDKVAIEVRVRLLEEPSGKSMAGILQG
jgi:hypothetical protein